MEPGPKKCARDLSHLQFDVSLYDYMLNQLDISLTSGNPQIDHGFLKNGLQRGQKLELVFANAECMPSQRSKGSQLRCPAELRAAGHSPAQMARH